jgi:hypothetical protein
MKKFRAIVAGILCAACVLVAHAQAGFAGKWQGETGSGRQVVLELNVKGQQLTGTFTLAQQTAEITDGRVADKTFSFKTTVEGRSPLMSGELVGEQVKLTVEGVPNPVMLTRVK